MMSTGCQEIAEQPMTCVECSRVYEVRGAQQSSATPTSFVDSRSRIYFADAAFAVVNSTSFIRVTLPSPVATSRVPCESGSVT